MSIDIAPVQTGGPRRRVLPADPSSTARKTVEILESLAGSGGTVGLSELARHLDSSRSSVLRILSALDRAGLVRRDPATRQYGLTFRLLSLSHSALDQLPWYSCCLARARDLSAALNSVAHLGVLDGREVVFLAKVEPPDPPPFPGRVGYRAPVHSTALGKALLAARRLGEVELLLGSGPLRRCTERTITSPADLLAELIQVGERGYAVDDEENRVGVRCVAAGVRDQQGVGIAAISVSSPAALMPRHSIPEVAACVRDAAGLASRDLAAPARCG